MALILSASLLVPGCGGGELPAADAEAMLRDLGKVEQGVRAGECEATRPTLRRLDRNVADLPEGVDAELRTSLDRGVEHLGRLVGQQCKQREPDPVVTEPEPITPPPVQTTPEPAPTVTEPPLESEEQQEEPKPEEPQPEEPKEPKEPKGDKPTEEDICGENPAPTC